MRAQEDISYQMPPQVIADLVDAPPTPLVRISPDERWMLLLERPGYPPIEEVAQDELRLAGLRINPRTNGSSRFAFYNGFRIRPLAGGEERAVQDLPAKPRMENISWAADGRHFAFTNETDGGIELWLVDTETARARRLTEAIVNDAMAGAPYTWLSDKKTILYRSVPAGRGEAPKATRAPSGPIVQSNDSKAAAVRTYQDLLQNRHDEALFEHYATGQLQLIDITTGQSRAIGEPGIVRSFAPSPDGNYMLVTYLHRPFSYIVPYYYFPLRTVIYDRTGKLVREVADTPLAEAIPKGFGAVPTGPRSFTWRDDAPAHLFWVEAQDGGDPKVEAEVRDQLFSLKAPFQSETEPGITFKLRYGGVTWGDNDLAIAYEAWWADRRQIVSRWQPENAQAGKEVLFDRSYEDRYNDPGSFELTANQYGRYVLLRDEDGQTLYLMGEGASPEGNRPFVDRFHLKTKQTERLWRSEAPYYEHPLGILDLRKNTLLTRRESREEPPNYFIRNWKTGKLQQLTDFENPYAALKGIQRELVRYKRRDGVEMTGTLYTPAGYDREKDGPLPVFMWAYPREYKSADAAGQVNDSPYEFIRINYGSPLFWVTQGYAIFDDFAMPIVGEGDTEPNETFVEQLRMNAESAIDKLVEMGVADRNRIGVGGHSYGAFMTANLLAHTDLFAAGVARSGAYNRTLTPFGFQSEERTYWEAPDVYNKMSPFMHAEKIKAPILLIHGQADNNSGTFPIQSERFYAALKGHGAKVRFVMLPDESHGYRARESIMHMLWETTQWLDAHVKNRKVEEQVVKP